MVSTSFRVIVVGGGPVGLTAAHALSRAGIDFLVLERRQQIVMDVGSNVVMSPVGLRAMAQLDLLQATNSVSSPLGRIDRLDHNGRDIGDLQIFNQMEKIHGLAPRVISRHDLMKVLYESLSSEDQQKTLPNKKLSDIKPTADGVTVTCADGSSFTGSIVIGADGAHSMVRDLMRKLAMDSGSTEINAEKPFLTTYRALWVRFPRNASLPVGLTCETHGRGAATQLFVGEDSGVIGVYERMDEPTRERQRYTPADQDALISRWGHIPVTPDRKITLGDVYASKIESGLVSLEEGSLEHWHWNSRIVLAGDSAHKFTPSTGAGCNNGMIDIVALVNELHSALESSQASIPSLAEVHTALTAYQTSRHDIVAAECARSGQATATATWQTGVHKFLDRHVISKQMVQSFMMRSGAKNVANTPAFNFTTGQKLPQGSVPWVDGIVRPVVQAH